MVYGKGMIRTRTISLGYKSTGGANYTTGFAQGALRIARDDGQGSGTDPGVSTIEP